jgi:murein DD-endopeptidase MepM/ murein hydrolase activator NlpD
MPAIGRRRGEPVRRSPRSQPARRPSPRRRFPLTTAIGAAAVTLAAVGAVTVSQAGFGSAMTSSDLHAGSAQATVLNGSSSIGTSDALSGRKRAVSRDSERQALQDAAHQKLQKAADQQARQRNAALKQLAMSAEKHANALARNAWGLPIPAGVYHLTAGFGDISGLWAHFHTGLDFACPTGTPIHAVAGGVITSVGWGGAYGNRTIETLPDGTELWYAHQSAFKVRDGEHVVRGQIIGLVGATGNVTGPHLHLEVRPGAGDPVDPYAALVAHGLHP